RVLPEVRRGAPVLLPMPGTIATIGLPRRYLTVRLTSLRLDRAVQPRSRFRSRPKSTASSLIQTPVAFLSALRAPLACSSAVKASLTTPGSSKTSPRDGKSRTFTLATTPLPAVGRFLPTTAVRMSLPKVDLLSLLTTAPPPVEPSPIMEVWFRTRSVQRYISPGQLRPTTVS